MIMSIFSLNLSMKFKELKCIIVLNSNWLIILHGRNYDKNGLVIILQICFFFENGKGFVLFAKLEIIFKDNKAWKLTIQRGKAHSGRVHFGNKGLERKSSTFCTMATKRTIYFL